jgi:phosphoenolpyruvate-protein kinase (PTS system EI component)
LSERVELNAMTSDALIEMIERKLKAYGLQKVIPADDVLGEAYQTFHPSQQLREKFEEMKEEFEATKIEVPEDLKEQVRAILDKHRDLRWDDAIQIVLDKTQLDRVRAEKQKAKKKSGDFSDADNDEVDDQGGGHT